MAREGCGCGTGEAALRLMSIVRFRSSMANIVPGLFSVLGKRILLFLQFVVGQFTKPEVTRCSSSTASKAVLVQKFL